MMPWRIDATRVRWAAASLAAAGCGGSPSVAARSPEDAREAQAVHLRARRDVATARELDREGVRSFQAGRYADAILYFRAAFRLGGPSSELWNIARSREKLDDPEQAVAAIDEYLAQHDLSPPDRADAEREAHALRARPSVLTVTTNPPGAVLAVDGKAPVGQTPLSIEVPAGAHTVVVHRDGYATERWPVDARFGRAIIVSVDLARGR